jgi:cytochrome c-type biogenesis protein CcmH/NrfG
MFFILLSPSSSIVPIPTEIAAERRVYLALAPVLVLAVIGVESLRRRFARSVTTRRLQFGFAGIALLLAFVTAARSETYTNPERLWRGVVREMPGNLRGYVNLASALTRESPPKYAEAETLFTHAIARDSTCRSGCSQFAYMLSEEGRLPEAAVVLDRMLKYNHDNGPVERRLASTLMKMGEFDRALPHLEHVAALYPTEQHLVVLAVVYLIAQRQGDSISEFDRAAQLYPANPEIKKLGGTLYAAARGPDAIPELKALALALSRDGQ